MHPITHSLRIARSLALGTTLSALSACETQSSRDEQPTNFAATSSGAATGASDAAAPTDDAAIVAQQPVLATATSPVVVVTGALCPALGRTEQVAGPRGLYPCRCAADRQGTPRWQCDESDLTIEGPLPPPELEITA
jgi:hypothetical protein